MATKEQIAEWKKAYGDVYEISVPNLNHKGQEVIPGGKKEYRAIFKKPGKQTVSYAIRNSGGMNDPIKFNESIVLMTFMEGDEEIKNHMPLFNAAADQLQDEIEQVEAKKKKL